MVRALICLTATIIFSCRGNDKVEDIEPSNHIDENSSYIIDPEFKEILDSLPYFSYPTIISPSSCCEAPELNSYQKKIYNYLPEGATFIGKQDCAVGWSVIFTSYLGDCSTPTFGTYWHQTGKMKDERSFNTSFCESNGKFWPYLLVLSPNRIYEIEASEQITSKNFILEKADSNKIVTKSQEYFATAGGQYIEAEPLQE